MKPSTNVQFTPYEISFCLYDIDRTAQWKQAIEDVIKKGDIVADAGAGTGILGVFAAMDGAEKVYSIELNDRFIKLIQHLSEKNNVEDVLEVLHGDASKIELPEKIDVLICELLCTGQFFEPQVQVINHLRKYFKPDTKIIPQQVESYIQLLDAHEILYGVRIDTDSRSLMLADDEPVSTKVRYDVIDFSKPVNEKLQTEVQVRARKSGRADAVVITGKAKLSDTIETERTKFLYNPEVIYLKEPLDLIKNKMYTIQIEYNYGCDTLDAVIKVIPSK
jgi:predicted RNA methylase